MKLLIFMLLIHYSCGNRYKNLNCNKCDTSIIENIELEKYFSEGLINDFICTLDASCSNNAEFLEAATERAYSILLNQTSHLINALKKDPDKIDLYIELISFPLMDYEFNKIIDVVKLQEDSRIKEQLLLALKNASSK